jgi:GNAT superfamily N-acetyltransferase
VITVRDARPADGEALAGIWLENARYYVALFPHDFRVPDEEGLAAWLEERLAADRPETSCWLTAALDGEVAGQAVAHVDEPSPTAARQILPDVGETRASVDALGTGDAFRRRGVATALVEAVEAWARARGATVISTDTYLASPVSIPFWEERMGYRRRSVVLTKRLD